MSSPKRAKLMSDTGTADVEAEKGNVPSEKTCELLVKSWEDVYKYNVGLKELTKLPVTLPQRLLFNHKSGSYVKCQNELYAISGYGSEDVEKNNMSLSSTWTAVASTMDRRADAGMVVIEDFIYAVGGTYKDAGPSTQTGERYNCVDDCWYSIARMSDSRAKHAFVRDESTKITYREVIVTEWERQTAAMGGIGRSKLSPFVIAKSDFAYALGGYNYNLDPLNTVERYDPAEDTWTYVSSMTHCREGLAAVAVSGDVYAIGGDDPRITNDDNFDPDDYDFPKTVEKYSGKSGRWSEIASLNEGRSSHFAFVFNNKIYVIGGHTGVVESLDLSDEENSWEVEVEIDELCGISAMVVL